MEAKNAGSGSRGGSRTGGKRAGAPSWGPENPHPFSLMKKELIWEGKYDETGNRREMDVAAAALPMMQTEAVDPPTGATLSDAFRNRLIRGDNKLVMASLLGEFAGMIDLIYIDPPFDVGVDFKMELPIGEAVAGKKKNVLELTAYRDTWGVGADSYSAVMFERVVLARKCLAETGSLFVHCDWRIEQVWRTLLDEVFGADHFRNQIVWTYGGSGRGAKAIAAQFPRNHDVILWYSKSDRWTYHPQFTERAVPIGSAAKAGYRKDEQGRWFKTAPRGDYTDASVASLESQGRIYRTRNGSVRIKYFLKSDDKRVYENVMVGDAWSDIPDAMHLPEEERTDYATQKPAALLERVIASASNEGDLVADFFVGSGTTAAAAEKLGRRWIAADVGRFAIQSTRKRVIGVQCALHAEGKPCRAFDAYGFGVPERARWRQSLGGSEAEYRSAVLRYFQADVTESAGALIAGRKGGVAVHVAGIDVVFDARLARAVALAARETDARAVHCLAWDFDSAIVGQLADIETETGVKLHAIPIPREVMDRNRAAASPWIGVPTLLAEPVFHATPGKAIRAVDVRLTGFVPAFHMEKSAAAALLKNADQNGLDFIDYWAIDFEWDASARLFNHHWHAFRTRKNRGLPTQSEARHVYDKPGTHAVCVRVVDVFGCESSTVLSVRA